jgi:hypothetical protein
VLRLLRSLAAMAAEGGFGCQGTDSGESGPPCALAGFYGLGRGPVLAPPTVPLRALAMEGLVRSMKCETPFPRPERPPASRACAGASPRAGHVAPAHARLFLSLSCSSKLRTPVRLAALTHSPNPSPYGTPRPISPCTPGEAWHPGFETLMVSVWNKGEHFYSGVDERKEARAPLGWRGNGRGSGVDERKEAGARRRWGGRGVAEGAMGGGWRRGCPRGPRAPLGGGRQSPLHTHTHTHAHTQARTHTHTHTCSHTRARAHTHRHTQTHTQTHIHTHTCTHAHTPHTPTPTPPSTSLCAPC